MIPAALALALVAAPGVGDLWPCAPGRGLALRLERDGEGTETRMTERALGARPGRLCALERRTTAPGAPPKVETVLVERLPDRLLWAGEAGTLTAFRPPLVKAPLKVGTKWSFAGVRYRITAVDETITVPAGRFEGAVRVVAASVKPGEFSGVTVYVPGVGPVLRVSNGARWVAEGRLGPSPKGPKAPSKSGG